MATRPSSDDVELCSGLCRLVRHLVQGLDMPRRGNGFVALCAGRRYGRIRLLERLERRSARR
jgi:hypothetical protein